MARYRPKGTGGGTVTSIPYLPRFGGKSPFMKYGKKGAQYIVFSSHEDAFLAAAREGRGAFRATYLEAAKGLLLAVDNSWEKMGGLALFARRGGGGRHPESDQWVGGGFFFGFLGTGPASLLFCGPLLGQGSLLFSPKSGLSPLPPREGPSLSARTKVMRRIPFSPSEERKEGTPSTWAFVLRAGKTFRRQPSPLRKRKPRIALAEPRA